MPWLAFLVLVIIISGSVVQAGLGMGFGLTVAPLLALLDPALVPGPTLWLGLLSAILVTWHERDAVIWREVGIGAIGRAVGVGIGAFVLASMSDPKIFLLVFGIMIAGAVLLSATGWQLRASVANLIAMSGLSGVMGIITSVGAPPMALIYSQRPAHEARPTLAAFFAIGCAMSLIGFNLSGWGQWRDLAIAGFMLPGVFFGTWLAYRIHGRFDKRYRPILLCIAGLAAVMLIWRGLS